MVVLATAVDFVDPLIGTASRRVDESNSAAMQPLVGVPFGMWQWTAMTRLSELGKVSFSDADEKIIGFIGTRQPAPWMGEYGQISLMPGLGDVDAYYESRGVAYDRKASMFKPYYCMVALGNGIAVEITGSSRCAMLRFAFPSNLPPHVVIDASRHFRGEMSDCTPRMGGLSFLSDSKATGWNADRADGFLGPPLPNFKARFLIETSRPFVASGGGAVADDCHGWMEFAPSPEPLVVKISQSMISDAQAAENMRRECGDDFDFDGMVARSKAAWSEKLSVIDIDADRQTKTIFYTAMYHALQFPREFSEYGRYYSAFDDGIHEGESYTSYSLWDTYRAEHPLLTLIAPERVDGMMTALLQMYNEGGWLPKWPNPAYTGIMVGAPAEIVLANAVACGFHGFDRNLAYEAVRHNAMTPSPADGRVKWTGREKWPGAPEGRGGLISYMERGYVAANLTAESVSRTLDFGHDDMAVAVLAAAVGREDDSRFFRSRARNYRNLWHSEKRMFWPRNANGTWKATPRYHWSDGDYTEQSAETAVWGVPYDVPGLIELMGGAATFETALDNYFVKHFFGGRLDGLTCHENETTHHCAYLYAAIGSHEKCAKTVRRILSSGYSHERWGMEGNDDCGAMSAWYIFSALGFYPLDPTSGEYLIGSPIVNSAEVKIGRPFDAAVFKIVVKGQCERTCIVRSVRLNGKELSSRRLRHSDIVRGGMLELEMADMQCP